jgi:hypothetical protein
MKRSALVVASLMLSGGLALADTPEQVAEQYFNQGNTAYNLARYDEAAAAFTKAYEALPLPEFLYNIAQSYRLGGNCKQALHFYKRFKSLKEKDEKSPMSAKKKAEVEKFITELTACAAKADQTAGQQPDSIDKPTGVGTGTGTGTTPTTGTGTTPTTGTGTTPTTGTGTAPTTGTGTTPTTGTGQITAPVAGGTVVGAGTTQPATGGKTVGGLEDPSGDDGEPKDGGVSAKVTPGAPKLVAVRFAGGIAKLSSGDLGIPVQPSVGITGGYPLALGSLTLELGAGFAWSPLPYQKPSDMSQQQGRMLGVRLAVGAAFPVASKINLRGELGLGVVNLGGLGEGNPLSAMRQATSINLPSFRFGVAAEYLIGPNLAAYVSPFGFAFSPGNAKLYGNNLREIDVLFGIGYRQ